MDRNERYERIEKAARRVDAANARQAAAMLSGKDFPYDESMGSALDELRLALAQPTPAPAATDDVRESTAIHKDGSRCAPRGHAPADGCRRAHVMNVGKFKESAPAATEGDGVEAIRAAFEHWHGIGWHPRSSLDVYVDGPWMGTYISTATEFAWMAWLGREAHDEAQARREGAEAAARFVLNLSDSEWRETYGGGEGVFGDQQVVRDAIAHAVKGGEA